MPDDAMPVVDPFRDLREGLADGSIKIWCYCDEYDGPEPARWMPPDDYHADVCCLGNAPSSRSQEVSGNDGGVW